MKEKVSLKLELHDDRTKQKAMKMVSGIAGVDSITLDMKDLKMTVVGDGFDPVYVVMKLRKICRTEVISVVSVGAQKEEKKEEPKKDEVLKNRKKVVYKLDIDDQRAKQKALQAVSCLPGVNSISMDERRLELTVIGDMDPEMIGRKLKKLCTPKLVSLVGPAREPHEKDEPKNDEVPENMKKVVFKLDLVDNQQAKQKALQAVSSFPDKRGVELIPCTCLVR